MVSLPSVGSICSLAWESVISAQFGVFCDQIRSARNEDGYKWVGGREYTVLLTVWLRCAESGCLWCRFLERHFLEDLRVRSGADQWPVGTVHVRVGCTNWDYWQATRQWEKTTIILNGLVKQFVMYTTKGTS